jgi:hypothetical protein
MIKASGRTIFVIATGLFLYAGAPSHAASDTDNAGTTAKADGAAGAPIELKKYTKPPRHHTQRKSSSAAKPSAGKNSAKEPTENDGAGATSISTSIANAKAQLAGADSPAANSKVAAASPIDASQAEAVSTPDASMSDALVVAADQLNDVDRSAREDTAQAAPPAAASTDAASPRSAPVTASGHANESSTWDQTSLIGKIFIGFGALLTLASAARMFIA